MNLHTILDVLFPSLCVGCTAELEKGAVLCNACMQTIHLHRSLFCGKCGARLPGGNKICHSSHPYILAAAGRYADETLRNLIHTLKFKRARSAAKTLAHLATRYLKQCDIDLTDYVLVPIPLSRKRERERGFNQTTLIANTLAPILNLEINERVLARTRHTTPQTELEDFDARVYNIQDCFTIVEPSSLKTRNILLLDDVTTSGATLSEASRALKKAGAKRIVGLVIAKA